MQTDHTVWNTLRLAVTGPEPHPLKFVLEFSPRAMTHEEADIIMAYNMIEVSVGGHSPIPVASDDIIIMHQLQARAYNLPATVKVTMEACSGRN